MYAVIEEPILPPGSVPSERPTSGFVAADTKALPACGTYERAADPPAGAAEGPPPLSTRELGWIRGYSALAGSLYDGSLTAATSWKRPCLDRLAKTGPPPTARLRAAHTAAREICEKLGNGGVYWAEKLIDETDARLGRLFLAGRPLRVARSLDDASHVDLTLGELAADVAHLDLAQVDGALRAPLRVAVGAT